MQMKKRYLSFILRTEQFQHKELVSFNRKGEKQNGGENPMTLGNFQSLFIKRP